MDKEKIIGWLKNPYNFSFIAIVLAIIGIRLYYFFITKNQPIWWDESEYMAQAKAIAGLVHYDYLNTRSILYPAVMSIFFIFDIANETFMRFFALLLPSVLVVILSYFMIKEMYPDKRIALISMAIMGVLWEHLFYSNRFQTENFALIFEFLALFIFYKCSLKKQDFYFIKSRRALIYVTLLAIISVLFRPGNIFFVPPLILFMLVLNREKVLSKIGIAIIIVGIAAIIASFIFTNIPQSFLNQYLHLNLPISWNSLTVFYGFFQSNSPNIPSLLFYTFLIGLGIAIFHSFLIIDKLENNDEHLDFKSDIFNVLLIICVLFIFVFIMRASAFEFRWFFPLLPALLAFTSVGIIVPADYIAKLFNVKALAVILILIIAGFGLYTQLSNADTIIKQKVDSYSQVRDAGLWLKQNYDKNEKVLSISYPQTVYYSELNVFSHSVFNNESEFDNYLEKNRPRLLEVSIFEKQPDWMGGWLEHNQNRTIPVKVYSADFGLQNGGVQAVLIIYELRYN